MAKKPKPKGSAASKVAAGPPSAGGAGKTHKRPAIGVPGAQTVDAAGNVVGYEGYTVAKEAGFGNRIGLSGPGTAPGPVYQAAPHYFEGDDLVPATMGVESIARLQRMMASAGLLSGTYRIGLWDDKSRGAYKNLLEYANSIGEDEQTALARYADSAPTEEGGSSQGGPQRAPLVIRRTNPDDLASVADTVAKRTLGRRLRDDERARFVSAYQAAESGAQTSAYDAEPTGGTVTDAPDPSVMAENQIRDAAPAEAGAHDVLGVYDAFLRKIGAA